MVVIDFLLNNYFLVSVIPGIITVCCVTMHFKNEYGFVTVGELTVFLFLGLVIGFAFSAAVLIIFILTSGFFQIRIFKKK